MCFQAEIGRFRGPKIEFEKRTNYKILQHTIGHMFITAVITTTYLQNGTKGDIKMKGHWITSACFKSDKQTGFYKVRSKEDKKTFSSFRFNVRHNSDRTEKTRVGKSD